MSELDSVDLNEKCQCCVAGDLDKTRRGQGESTHVSEKPLTASKYFHKQSFQGGKDLIFPYWEKSPNKAIRELNTLSHKQHLGHIKLTFEISEIKRRSTEV